MTHVIREWRQHAVELAGSVLEALHEELYALITQGEDLPTTLADVPGKESLVVEFVGNQIPPAAHTAVDMLEALNQDASEDTNPGHWRDQIINMAHGALVTAVGRIVDSTLASFADAVADMRAGWEGEPVDWENVRFVNDPGYIEFAVFDLESSEDLHVASVSYTY